MAWGVPEYENEVNDDEVLFAPNMRNKMFVAAAGNNGGEEGKFYPAASPRVLSVGGTKLKLDPNDDRLGESAWAKTTGGESAYFLQPLPRRIPDVSFHAAPANSNGYSVINGGVWYVVGGTSAAAAQWAGIIAAKNSHANFPLNTSINYSSERNLDFDDSLYELIDYQPNGGTFYDIVRGNNGACAACQANPEYDQVTGIGTPRVDNLVKPF